MGGRLKQRQVAMQEVTEETVLINKNDGGKRRVVRKKVTLYRWDDLPEWQKDNHYIHGGYVKETLSLRACIDSLTYLHNESVNIYSHLVPGFCCLVLLLVSFFHFFPITIYDDTTFMDYFIISLFIFGASSCLLLSSAFHCLKAHSLAVSTFGNKLDYLGIVILIVTSMVGIIYYAFKDSLVTGLFFNFITVSLGVVCAIVSLKDEFRKPSLRGVRAAMFVFFGLSGVLPILYGLFKYGPREVWKRSGLGFVLLEALFYIAGAVLYGSRVPERFAPGSFDYYGNSHQIFHFFVVIAACCHGRALMKSYDNAHASI